MATEYTDAADVRKVANKIIAECHPHLHGVRIDYVFISKTDKEGTPQPILSKGKTVHGRARKVSGLNAFLAQNDHTPDGEDFFVMEISFYSWSLFTPEQRIALVDHELCHFALDEESGTPTIREHDVEEFSEVVKRRGLWQEDVRQFVEIGARQLQLPLATKGRAARASQPVPNAF